VEEKNQEAYLSETGFKAMAVRGLKKFITELTSVKFLLLIFVCVALSQKWVGDVAGLATALVLVGAREMPPIDQIITMLKGGKNDKVQANKKNLP